MRRSRPSSGIPADCPCGSQNLKILYLRNARLINWSTMPCDHISTSPRTSKTNTCTPNTTLPDAHRNCSRANSLRQTRTMWGGRLSTASCRKMSWRPFISFRASYFSTDERTRLHLSWWTMQDVFPGCLN